MNQLLHLRDDRTFMTRICRRGVIFLAIFYRLYWQIPMIDVAGALFIHTPSLCCVISCGFSSHEKDLDRVMNVTES